MSTSVLDLLPVEVLYRIFDNLDIGTLVFSLRYVCQRVYFITNSYNRYDFNFKFMSKQFVRLICDLIPLENVIALTLSDEDRTRGQIEYFLSSFHIEQLIRLQSLTLLHIENHHLTRFLTSIHTSQLKCLHIDTVNVLPSPGTSSENLSQAIALDKLRYLQLNMAPDDCNDIQWPINHTLHYLRIINNITLEQFCHILQQSLHLRTVVLKEIPTDDCTDDKIVVNTYSQLISLTFEDSRIDLDKLDRCFSLTPSLTYLKLLGHGTLFDLSFNGYRWESLIQRKLPQLKTFEFSFSILIYSHYRSRHIELIMTPFRTSFWLNDIRCSIMCDYILNSRKVILYTVPICINHFVYQTDSRKISLSNLTLKINANDMRNVTQLELQLKKDINSQSIDKSDECNQVLFGNVTDLALGNDGEWPKGSIKFLSTILNLSQLDKLSLSISFVTEHMSNLVSNLHSLLNQTSNLRSLLLFDYWTADNCLLRMKIICSLISPNIKHLQIRVKNIDEIRCILERLEHLTSVTFEYSPMLTIEREEFIRRLADLDRFSSLWYSKNALHVWFGTKKNVV